MACQKIWKLKIFYTSQFKFYYAHRDQMTLCMHTHTTNIHTPYHTHTHRRVHTKGKIK